MIYIWIALAVSIAGDVLLGKLYLGKRDDLAVQTQKYDGLVASVKTIGEKAAKDAADKKAADEKLKKDADNENAATVARLTADIDRLRRDADRARGSLVPAAPSGSKRPDLACFDRQALESADGEFLAAIRGIADKGTAATVNLATASKWATSLSVR